MVCPVAAGPRLLSIGRTKAGIIPGGSIAWTPITVKRRAECGPLTRLRGRIIFGSRAVL